MKRAILAPAELGGAALDELKQWLAITTPNDDPTLISLLEASLELCEAFTGTAPIAATYEEIWPASREWQTLSTRPILAITGVEGIPAEGPRFALAPDAYEMDLGADGTGMVRIIRQGAAGRIAVRFTAGLAPGWGSLPAGLRHGTIRLAAQHFRERDSGFAAMPPAAVTALWRPWRRLRLT
ncbi:hypothetical protein GCM10023115_02550 [Pontixanthobacter gangjinensis]|uniref:PhiE125 gp8 family phage protein n=1 Tax=Pontixanthobacter gangjinensis TaxID=1028742 RepID=A0A6I4SJB6_9SPHN|nr:hypothetical protein [Pontixanthobacter gangjinensis]MXO55508.1 hypothetical protein [Pontixanthobacter gangjinensis]